MTTDNLLIFPHSQNTGTIYTLNIDTDIIRIIIIFTNNILQDFRLSFKIVIQAGECNSHMTHLSRR